MKYLTSQDILVMHKHIIDATSGAHGIRDIGLLISIEERPKMTFSGEELYSGVFLKASVYLDSIIRYHVFIDGNKRTAFASTVRFLYQNGYKFTAGNREVEEFVLKVTVEELDLSKISAWIKKYSKKM